MNSAHCPIAVGTVIALRPRTDPYGPNSGTRLVVQMRAGRDGWPMRAPVNASPAASRLPVHGSGSMRFAAPSSQRTCTARFLPVSPAHLSQATAYHALLRSPDRQIVGRLRPEPRPHTEMVPVCIGDHLGDVTFLDALRRRLASIAPYDPPRIPDFPTGSGTCTAMSTGTFWPMTRPS